MFLLQLLCSKSLFSEQCKKLQLWQQWCLEANKASKWYMGVTESFCRGEMRAEEHKQDSFIQNTRPKRGIQSVACFHFGQLCGEMLRFGVTPGVSALSLPTLDYTHSPNPETATSFAIHLTAILFYFSVALSRAYLLRKRMFSRNRERGEEITFSYYIRGTIQNKQ